MEASFVSRARTAINSAASKAEKVFTDIKKSDSIAHHDLDKQSPLASTVEYPKDADESKNSEEANNKRARPYPIKTKQDWHEKFRNLRLGKKGAEDSGKPDNSQMAYAIFDDNLYMMHERQFSQSNDLEEAELESSKAAKADIIPSSAIVKQLAVAIEAGSGYSSMKDLLASSKASSPIREKASMSISVMKSLVLRERDDKMIHEFGSDDRILAVMNALLNAEGQFTGRTVPDMEIPITTTSLVKDIHGAPLESFLVKLSEAISCLKTMRKMASFWSRVVSEIRRLWYEGQYIPGIPPGDLPDLNSCLLYQQLQVINCCISRKKRHTAALESLESVTAQEDATGCLDSESALPLGPRLYAKSKSGELVLRLGADKTCENLIMIETGEPIYSPVMQEPPLLTEDSIKETEEFVLRTGSVGAGCSQLLSDMQAFKAANPGCTLEDFVRWHSPPDWMEDDPSSDLGGTSEGGDSSSVRGQLSMRMQKEGNLWRELWETSKPVPAVRQAPLYDEDLAVEGILDFLEEISPSELFKQLFVVALGAGLIIAEAMLSTNPNLSSVFSNCKNYIVATLQGSTWVEKLDDICQVYETVETMVHNRDEAINISPQPEETTTTTTTTGEVKSRFKKLSLIFGGKSKNTPKDLTKNEESPDRQHFSIFSKKPPKPTPSPSGKPSASGEDDWTIV